MKKANKIIALAMSAAILIPSVSHASDINSIITGLYDGMDAISETAGTEKIQRPALPAGRNTVTNTTTTVTTDKTSTGQTNKAKEEKIASLKESLYQQDLMIQAAEDILANYPKTIKGREEQVVATLTKAYDLRIKASAAIEKVTGEKIEVRPLNIPQEYRFLIRTY